MKTISFSAAFLFASAVVLTGVVFAAAAQDTKAPPAEVAPADNTAALPMANMTQMNHITTQAQAEALKPGDSMSMTCSKCKDVMVQKVTADNAHVKMMTVGEKVTCGPCGGTVEVVATGKGTGKDAEVKHVCSICGDDAMFCAATAPGSGSMKNMNDMEKAAKPKMSEEEMKKMKKQ
tara:strand:- start:1407 stop:1937 length:531 start_codon:yes stop_codon:yes gene_type:complete